MPRKLVEGGSGAAPNFDPFHVPLPERQRQRGCGGAGGQHIVDNRNSFRPGRPPADRERLLDIRKSLRRVAGPGLGRRVVPDDAYGPRASQAEVASNHGRKLFGVVESTLEEATSGQRQPDHHFWHGASGPYRQLSREKSSEGCRRRHIPRVLHPVNETGERRPEAPRSDYPVEWRRIHEAGRTMFGRVPGRCGEALVLGSGRGCTSGTHGTQKQRIERAAAVPAGIERGSCFAAEAARLREQPRENGVRRNAAPQSVHHLFHSDPRSRGVSGPRRPPARTSTRKTFDGALSPGHRPNILARLRLGPTRPVRSHPCLFETPPHRSGRSLVRFVPETALQTGLICKDRGPSISSGENGS